jgi:hypothetical protein
MKKYKIILYPNINDYKTEVEADSVEEAIERAEHEANNNCYFMATVDDVTEIEE